MLFEGVRIMVTKRKWIYCSANCTLHLLFSQRIHLSKIFLLFRISFFYIYIIHILKKEVGVFVLGTSEVWSYNICIWKYAYFKRQHKRRICMSSSHKRWWKRIRKNSAANVKEALGEWERCNQELSPSFLGEIKWFLLLCWPNGWKLKPKSTAKVRGRKKGEWELYGFKWSPKNWSS